MNYELNIKGKPYIIDHPLVMGILNCTPDSFYAGSRKQTEQDIINRTKEIILQGGEIIDVGAMSTRPGGTFVTEEEEMQRLRFALPLIHTVVDSLPTGEGPACWGRSGMGWGEAISVDTYRPNVARMAVEEYGVDIINDVGAPANNNLHSLEKSSRNEMYRSVAELHVPYILMSSQPTVDETITWLSREVNKLNELGVKDIILDPGYGFGKTLEQNFQILKTQQKIVDTLKLPLLSGISRKRMIYQTLDITPDEALNGTTILNTLALERGASILRVHDVKEAVECVKLVNML